MTLAYIIDMNQRSVLCTRLTGQVWRKVHMFWSAGLLFELANVKAKPVGTNKPGCRVLLGVAVMCPAGCKGGDALRCC
jgi:hypothetical protein